MLIYSSLLYSDFPNLNKPSNLESLFPWCLGETILLTEPGITGKQGVLSIISAEFEHCYLNEQINTKFCISILVPIGVFALLFLPSLLKYSSSYYFRAVDLLCMPSSIHFWLVFNLTVRSKLYFTCQPPVLLVILLTLIPSSTFSPPYTSMPSSSKPISWKYSLSTMKHPINAGLLEE